jgi:hypothetical protein
MDPATVVDNPVDDAGHREMGDLTAIVEFRLAVGEMAAVLPRFGARSAGSADDS